MVIVAALLLTAAVCCWPTRSERRRRQVVLASRTAASTPAIGSATGAGVRRLLEGRHPRVARERRGAQILQVVSGLASALEAGLTPAAALASCLAARPAGADDPEVEDWWDRVVTAANEGRAVGPVWRAMGEHLGVPVAIQVGRAWGLSERLGSPLTAAVRTTLAAHEATERLERAFAAQSAGPRATVQVLTSLPLLGLLLMPLLGGSLVQAYPPGVLLLAVLPGLVLMAAGRAWSRRLVDRALRPPRVA